MPDTKTTQTQQSAGQSNGQPIVKPPDQQQGTISSPKKANSDGQPIVKP